MGSAVFSRVCWFLLLPKNIKVFGEIKVFGKGMVAIISKNYKGRCEKVVIGKSEEVCRAYTPMQLKYAQMLQDDSNIVEVKCNVLLDGLEMSRNVQSGNTQNLKSSVALVRLGNIPNSV